MMMPRLNNPDPVAIARTLLLSALLLCLAACNRNSSSAGSSSGTSFSNSTAALKDSSVGNACALVTKADAEAVYGVTVTPIHVQIMGGDRCQYAPASDPVNSPKQLSIDLDPLVRPGSSTSESESWQNTKTIDKGMHDKLPSAGLGEDSYFSDSLTGKGVELRVLASHRILTIEVEGLKDVASQKDAEKKLAQIALSRL
jgi:hypothetical protein